MKHYFFLLSFCFFLNYLYSNDTIITKWVDKEFQPSTLSRTQQIEEMQWFRDVSKPFRGMEIRVVSERINTHLYETNTLVKAFREITGIDIIHEITAEDDVIKKIIAQKDLGLKLYDMYICDSDLIGTFFRSDDIIPISDFIKNEGRFVTLSTLDIDDFIGLKFTTGPDNRIYQLPDQQFANLYWYRADWFAREDLKKKFKSIYGYELDIPLNWSAYEDIAEFFTVHVKYLDSKRVYGHMDYGSNDPSLGWRFSDAWLSMAGVGDGGLPNGLPVDEWGIRVENNRAVGASVERGGALNSPAAIYALDKYYEWLIKYAPPEARNLNFTQAGPVPGEGNIAQQIFWYTAFTSDLIDPELEVVNKDGTPKWRMAPSPHGAYWNRGMKMGYQDVGAWTMFKNVPLDRRKAAWLYAQFVVSKTVSLKKTIVGLTPIRESDINSKEMGDLAPKLGGLVEFYRSEAKHLWTPTGSNVPDYPFLSGTWYNSISKRITGEFTSKQSMDELAANLDEKLQKLSSKEGMKFRPYLNDKREYEYWINIDGSPKPELSNEKPLGITISYEEALKIYE